MLKALFIEFHTFPKKIFKLLHACFDMQIIEFGFQPPIKLQDAAFISSYEKNSTLF